MASKGGVGIRLDMNKVPCREEGMTPYEMMLSESQERMLMVLKPGREGEAEAIFRKWELDFAVIGEVTDTGRMVLECKGEPRHQRRLEQDRIIASRDEERRDHDRHQGEMDNEPQDGAGRSPFGRLREGAGRDEAEHVRRLAAPPERQENGKHYVERAADDCGECEGS
jgi:phosphoribosylformylglycinamidine (FGAM) synthase-like enzyme